MVRPMAGRASFRRASKCICLVSSPNVRRQPVDSDASSSANSGNVGGFCHRDCPAGRGHPGDPAVGALRVAGSPPASFAAGDDRRHAGVDHRRDVGGETGPWRAGSPLDMGGVRIGGDGTLDLVHAGVEAGDNFVWLHSMASLVGGILFLGVWLPPPVSRRLAGGLPSLVLLAAIVFGLTFCACPSWPR